MIGTVTVSTAVIGFLGFFGINNIKELKNVVLKTIGKQQNGVEISQNGDVVELTKDGDVILQFDINAVEQLIANTDTTNSDTNTVDTNDNVITFGGYTEFRSIYWDILVTRPLISRVWQDKGLVILEGYFPAKPLSQITIRMPGDNVTYDKLDILARQQ